ncbi:MAG: ribosome small subunit-dependent GTPase A [Ruminococcaceae bacterium]|nr:ribosome small subunit-dependent GTPase A [Oscillospiraceae bacterium]
MPEGTIIKGIGGFYYVEAAGSVYECRARGLLRKQGIIPLAGDRCELRTGEGDMPLVWSIKERRNSLVRPPVANIDKLLITVSSVSPEPNMLVIDRMTANAELAGIEPVIVITKLDLKPCDEVAETYRKAGYRVIGVNYQTGEGVEEVRAEMKGCVSAFAGNSGVGKSTLLNAIEPQLAQKTAEISQKLGRGRHTTRTVELFRLSFGAVIADTPGFSSFDTELCSVIEKDVLPECFREFEQYIGQCRFTSCAHLCEKGCAVVAAVERGDIAKSRHESYCVMYEEAKSIKPWENR